MAGDWIKMRTALADDPAVIAMAMLWAVTSSRLSGDSITFGAGPMLSHATVTLEA
ncbi:hypothetical protein AWB83_06512 [Caballeronia ptereochthonis]|uniref:Uncharacterized protein n=1 Tax=Caballeronia ptereochthonis TaxID=1777144 RepID=A0A158E542_9BURK|nr:hypothetical protein AWB83_06512 [Caballeronia ptereochthonis]